MKLKKALIVVLAMLASCVGFFSGCTNKYEKVNLELSQETLTLTLSNLEGEKDLKTFKVNATLSNVPENMLKELTYTQTNTEVVNIAFNLTENSNVVEVVFTAISGGTSVVNIKHAESGKSAEITVNVIERLNSIFTIPNGGAFAVVGKTTTFSTAKNVGFVPSTSTEKDITYSLTSPVEGITITSAGEITIASTVELSTVNITATSVSNSQLSTIIPVKIIKPIIADDVQIKSGDANVNEIVLSSEEGADNTLELEVQVTSSESVKISPYFSVKGIAEIYQENEILFNVSGIKIGSAILTFKVSITNYEEYFVEKQIVVNVKQKPNQVKVNGETKEKFAFDIFDWYSNGLGEKINLEVAPIGTSNKNIQIIIPDAVKALLEFSVYDNDKRVVVDPAEFFLNGMGENVYVLNVSTTEYINQLKDKINGGEAVDGVKIVNGNIVAQIKFYALGCEEFSSAKVYANCEFTLKKGIESIIVNNLFNNTLFVKTGELLPLNISITPSDALIADVFASVQNEKIVEIVKTSEGISLKGLINGATKLTLFSKTGATTNAIDLVCFTEATNFGITAPTPQENSNVFQSEYINNAGENSIKSLNAITIAKNSGIQLSINTLPIKSTIVSLSYASDNTSIASVNDAGFVVGRDIGTCNLTATFKTYFLNNEGKLEQKTLEKNFAITVINPLKSFNVATKSVTIVNGENLGYYGTSKGLNTVLISLSIDSTSATCIANDAIKTNLRMAFSNDYNGKINAELIEEAGTYSIKITSNIPQNYLTSNLYLTLTITLQEYSRYYIQTCQVIIKPAVKVNKISILNIEEDSSIYLEARNGLNEFLDETNYEEAGAYNNTFKIDVQTLPQNATNSSVKYVFFGNEENKNVCYIQKDGTVIPFKAGTAKFRIIPEDAFINEFTGANYLQSLENGYLFKEITIVIADGTQTNPYLISNAQQLQNINNGLDKYYVLANNIDMSNVNNFVSIGTDEAFTGGLNGTYQGISYSVLGLNISESNAKNGLFFQNNGTIENLKLEINSINIVGNSNYDFIFGGLCAENSGLILKCFVNIKNTNITGQFKSIIFGAMVGINNGSGNFGIKGDYDYFDSEKTGTTVSGNIIINASATESAVGGVVAINNGKVEYVKAQTSIFAENLNNVGGVVGVNNLSINNAYYFSNILCGNENVGGIVGLMNEKSTLSYGIVEIFNSTVGSKKIIAKNNFGGLIGKVNASSGNNAGISYCFVRSYGTNDTNIFAEETNLENKNVGGLIGSANYLTLTTSYVNLTNYVELLTNTLNFGGLIGNASNSSIENCYVQGDFKFNSTDNSIINVGGLIGKTSNININKTYSTAKMANENALKNSFYGLCESAIGSNNYYEQFSNNQNGFGEQKTNIFMTNQTTFVGWDFTNVWQIESGKNSSYPYLKRGNSSFLTTIPTAISLTLKENLIILNENNLNVGNTNTIQPTGKKVVLNFEQNKKYDLSDLVELSFYPSDAQKNIIIETSDNSIISVNDSTLTINKIGYVVITVKSSYSNEVFDSFEICVADLFSAMKITDASGNDLKNGEIKVKSNSNENVYVSLLNNNIEILSNYNFGIIYTSTNTTDLKISNKELNNLLTYSRANVLQAQAVSQNVDVSIKATPFVKVNFNGEQYVVYFKDYAVSFTTKIYLGVDEIYLSETENEISLKNQLEFSLFVKTDLPDEDIVISKKILSNEIFEDVEITNDFVEILKTNKQIENGYVKYDYKVFVKEEFLQYAGEGVNQFNKENIVKLNFYQNSSLNKVATFTLTVLPQKVLKIDLNHYPAGEVQNFGGTTSYYPQELPDNRINPGKQGILKINVYPSFSNFDYLEITSSLDAKNNRVYFQQVVFDKINKSYEVLNPAYNSTTYGINLKPVSYTDGTFDGSVFVKTLIVSKVEKGTNYKLIVTAYKNDEIQYSSSPYALYAENLPGITLMYGTSTRGYVAKGTTNQLLNYEITDYESDVEPIFVATVKDINGTIIASGATISKITDTNYCQLTVADNVAVGSKIYVSGKISRTINGLTETSTSTVVLTVVDFLIKSVSEKDSIVSQENSELGTLTMSLGSQHKLEVDLKTINHESENSKINSFKTIISKQLQNWQYVRSYSASAGTQTTESIELNRIYGNFAVMQKGDNYFVQTKKVSTNSMLQLTVKYGYAENGEIAYCLNNVYYNINGETVSVVDAFEKNYVFNLNIIAKSELTNPIPISTKEEFLAMQENYDYILMENIELDEYNSISTKIASLDGNGKTITIKKLYTETTGTKGQYGLFSVVDENTILKNLTVKYDTDSIALPITKTEIYFGGITAENNGVITNCEVIKGNGNLTFSQTVFNSSTYIGGLCAINNGYISNSRFGDVNNNVEFKLSAPANVAGFVYANNGKIASCYVGGAVEINNTSTQIGQITTAGFVGTNSGTISYSFVEGYCGSAIIQANGVKDGRIYSSGNVAGFVYNNGAIITDCYSLIKLETYSGRISGFVYKNNSGAKINNSYSACTFNNSEANMFFCGNNDFNEIQAKEDDIIDCYYYVENETQIVAEEIATPIDKSAFGRADSFGSLFADQGGNWQMGVYWVEGDNEKNNINSTTDVVPEKTTGIRPFLATARTKSISVRISGEGDETIYPYWYEYTSEKLGAETNPILISDEKEFIFYLSKNVNNNINYNNIRFIKDVDLSLVSDADLKTLQNIIFAGKIDGNNMILSNLRVIASDNTTASESFGLFKQIGLDFMVEKVNSTYQEKFDINIPDSSKRTVIKNLNIEVAEISATEVASVGVLSGEIINSKILNVKLTGNNVVVEGKNMVGALAGRISGDSTIVNVSSNISVRAVNDANITNEQSVYNETAQRKLTSTNSGSGYKATNDAIYSFAGGIAGVIDIYQIDFKSKEGDLFNVKRNLEDLTVTNSRVEMTSYNIGTLTVEGSVEIMGSVAGGVVGYLGSGTTLCNGYFLLTKQTSTTETQNILGKYCAGGLIGVSKGYVYKSKVSHTNSVQQAIDEEALAYANEEDSAKKETIPTGNYGEKLFYSDELSPKYVGGLVGMQIQGTIVDCYSRANVINRNAVYAGGNVINRNAVYAGGLVGKMIYQFGKNEKDNPATLYNSSRIISSYTTANVLSRQAKSAQQAGEQGIIAGKSGGLVGYLEIIQLDITVSENKYSFKLFYGAVASNNWQIEEKDANNTGALIGECKNSNEIGIVDLLAESLYCTSSANTTKEIFAVGNITVNGAKNAVYNKYLTHRTNSEFPKTITAFSNFDIAVWDLTTYSMPVINYNYMAKTLIRTSQDLKNMLPNGYYVLVSDIYLDDYWTPANINFAGTLTSLKTEDSTSENPKFYTIYNLNINTTKEGTGKRTVGTNEISSGLFAQTDKATLMNFNVVVGTNKNEVKEEGAFPALKDCQGIEAIKESAKSKYYVGALAGKASGTTVVNVSITYNQFYENLTAKANLVSTYDYVGGIFGYAENCSFTNQCILKNVIINCNAEDDKASSNERCVGAIAGEMSANSGEISLKLQSEYNNIDFISVNGNAKNLYVGGLFGKLSDAKINLLNCEIPEQNILNIKVNNKHVATETNPVSTLVGGLVAKAKNVEITANNKDINSFNIYVATKDNSNSNSSNAYVGGIVADANIINISGLKFSSSIANIDAESFVDGTAFVGNIIGRTDGDSTIQNCVATSNVDLTAKNAIVGGLIGSAQNTTITKCAVDGNIKINTENENGDNIYGGVVGDANGNLANKTAINSSFANVKADLNFKSTAFVGGFAGKILDGKIDNCYCLGEIKLSMPEPKEIEGTLTATPLTMGGFVGKIENSTFAESLTFTATMLKSNLINTENVGPFAGVSLNTTFVENTKYIYEFVGAVERENEYANAENQQNLLNTSAISYVETDLAFEMQNIEDGSFFKPVELKITKSTETGKDEIKLESKYKYYFLKDNIIYSGSSILWPAETAVINGNGKTITLTGSSSLFKNIGGAGAVLNLGIMYDKCKMDVGSDEERFGAFATTNSGYINQCFVSGKIVVENINNDFSGFVANNNGYLYTSASSVIFEQKEVKAINNSYFGFVLTNSTNAIIYNSYTTAIFGTKQTDAGENNIASGFVNLNSGKIANAYSASVLNFGANIKKAFCNNGSGIIANNWVDVHTVSTENLSTSTLEEIPAVLKSAELSDAYNYGYPTLKELSLFKNNFFTGDGTIITNGDKTEEKPYQVQSLRRLKMLETTTTTENVVYYEQICDFDLKTYENFAVAEPINNFEYNGNNFAINNLSQITNKSHITANGGLFAKINDESIITNLGLINVEISVSGEGNSGAFASVLNGTLKNCYAKGKLNYVKNSGNKNIGGLAGTLSGTIDSCYSEIKLQAEHINITTNTTMSVGGIAGASSGNATIKSSIANSTIKDYVKKAVITSNFAGLVGSSNALIIENNKILSALEICEDQINVSNFANGTITTNTNNIAYSDLTMVSGGSNLTESVAKIETITDERAFQHGVFNLTKTGNLLVGNNMIIGTASQPEITALPSEITSLNNFKLINLTLKKVDLSSLEKEDLVVYNCKFTGYDLLNGILGDADNVFLKEIVLKSNTIISTPEDGYVGFLATNLTNSYLGKIAIDTTNTITTTDKNIGLISGKGTNVAFENITASLGTTANRFENKQVALCGLMASAGENGTAEKNEFVEVYGTNTINIYTAFVKNTGDVLIAGLIGELKQNTTMNVIGSSEGAINHIDADISASGETINGVYNYNKYYAGGFVAKNSGKIIGGTNNIAININIGTGATDATGYCYLYSKTSYPAFNEDGTYKTQTITVEEQITLEDGTIIPKGSEMAVIVYDEEETKMKDANGQNYYGYLNPDVGKYYKEKLFTNEIIFETKEILKSVSFDKTTKTPDFSELESASTLPNGCEWAYITTKTPSTQDGKFVTDENGIVFVETKEQVENPSALGEFYYSNNEITYETTAEPIEAKIVGAEKSPNTTGVSVEETTANTALMEVYYVSTNFFGVQSVKSEQLASPIKRETISYVGGICGYSFEGSKIENTKNLGNIEVINRSTTKMAQSVGGKGGAGSSLTVDDLKNQTGSAELLDIRLFTGGVAGFAEQTTYGVKVLVQKLDGSATNTNENKGKISGLGGKRFYSKEKLALQLNGAEISEYIYLGAFAMQDQDQDQNEKKINKLSYAGSLFGGNKSGKCDNDADLCNAKFELAVGVYYQYWDEVPSYFVPTEGADAVLIYLPILITVQYCDWKTC